MLLLNELNTQLKKDEEKRIAVKYFFTTSIYSLNILSVNHFQIIPRKLINIYGLFGEHGSYILIIRINYIRIIIRLF